MPQLPDPYKPFLSIYHLSTVSQAQPGNIDIKGIKSTAMPVDEPSPIEFFLTDHNPSELTAVEKM